MKRFMGQSAINDALSDLGLTSSQSTDVLNFINSELSTTGTGLQIQTSIGQYLPYIIIGGLVLYFLSSGRRKGG